MGELTVQCSPAISALSSWGIHLGRWKRSLGRRAFATTSTVHRLLKNNLTGHVVHQWCIKKASILKKHFNVKILNVKYNILAAINYMYSEYFCIKYFGHVYVCTEVLSEKILPTNFAIKNSTTMKNSAKSFTTACTYNWPANPATVLTTDQQTQQPYLQLTSKHSDHKIENPYGQCRCQNSYSVNLHEIWFMWLTDNVIDTNGQEVWCCISLPKYPAKTVQGVVVVWKTNTKQTQNKNAATCLFRRQKWVSYENSSGKTDHHKHIIVLLMHRPITDLRHVPVTHTCASPHSHSPSPLIAQCSGVWPQSEPSSVQ